MGKIVLHNSRKCCNGINKESIQICQVIAYDNEIAVVFNEIINNERTRMRFHTDVIWELAIPYWRSIAISAFNFDQVKDIGWILITNLWEQSHLETKAR